jgi:UDP-N-acetylmuramoylalanine--D-glutamate ligase
VKYYNDSFGTTPETAIVALQAFEQPKIAILGGSDKGASYDELAKVVSDSNVRRVLLIGEQAGRIQAALDAAGFSNYADGGQNITEIVANARSNAQAGDVVLLSTACASFDMFQNYKDRGTQFKAAVQALA